MYSEQVIDDLGASHWLDQLIATAVMGWVEKEKGYWVLPDGSECEDVYMPHYSQNIGDAMLIIPRLETHPDEILFSLVRKGYSQETLLWAAEFRKCRGNQHHYYADANTAPLAICRAALKIFYGSADEESK